MASKLKSRHSAALLPLFAMLAFPADAAAHTTMAGANHFTGGILHPLMTPAHVLILLALGVSLGQHVPLRSGVLLRVFAPSASIALALTMTGWIPIHPALLAVIALGAGAVVAIGKPLPSFARCTLFSAGALAIGLDSGVETGGTATVISTLLGTWIGLLLFLFAIAYYASLAAERKRQWIDIALRVAGSWNVAISLLMLAFALRK